MTDEATITVGAGGEAMLEVGTELGMADHEMTTTLGDDGTVSINEAGTDETQAAGTTYGDENESKIDDGINEAATETEVDETYDEAGMATTAVDGIEAMTETGTLFGTLVQSTITADGDEAMVMIKVYGTDETHETGTTTGVAQVVGTTTVAGT
jgi:hypothetical protein